MPNLESKNGCFQPVFRMIILKVQDDRQVGVSNEGRSSFIAIGRLNDGKRVLNEESPTPWCHMVVHYDSKMSCF